MTTQFAKASYQEIIDLHTEEDTVSVIGIHTPQGDTPRKMFGGFFDQFKKFKYLGCSVSLVPAARLPADPLQVSLQEAGEPTIDPRDMLNPLMFHGCHGNDMGVILNRFYNTNSIADIPQSDSTFYYADSITDISEGDHISGLQLEDLYYKALTDNTWKKAHPQRGFRKSGLRPLVYSMATNMQFSGGDSIGMDGFGIPEDMVTDVSTSGQNVTATFPVSQNGRRFFTPRLTGLGWLDTRNVLTTATTVTGSTADIRAMLGDASLNQQNASEADLPLVYMGMILLPPAYKTEQYFRMIVNHHFAFKDFRGISFSNNLVEPPSYNQLNDPDERYYPEGGSVDPPTPDPDPPISGGDTYLTTQRQYYTYVALGTQFIDGDIQTPLFGTDITPYINATVHDNDVYALDGAYVDLANEHALSPFYFNNNGVINIGMIYTSGGDAKAYYYNGTGFGPLTDGTESSTTLQLAFAQYCTTVLNTDWQIVAAASVGEEITVDD